MQHIQGMDPHNNPDSPHMKKQLCNKPPKEKQSLVCTPNKSTGRDKTTSSRISRLLIIRSHRCIMACPPDTLQIIRDKVDLPSPKIPLTCLAQAHQLDLCSNLGILERSDRSWPLRKLSRHNSKSQALIEHLFIRTASISKVTDLSSSRLL